MGLTMGNLQMCFESAMQAGAKFIGVAFKLPGSPEPEIIINPAENFESKLEYYKKTYNENLGHDRAPGLQITGFTFGDGFDEIQAALLGGVPVGVTVEEMIEQAASFGFDLAIDLLKDGYRVARQGWNGKGMFLVLVKPTHYTTHTLVNVHELLPWIGMKTADNKFVPWLASQTDVLAEDWVVLK